MNVYVHSIYKLTKYFPKEELYGSSSQLRRAALSVILNFIEGFTRRRSKVKVNQFEIAYGSLHESQYLIGFALEEKWITQIQHDFVFILGDEIGAMLWSEIKYVQKNT